MCSRRSKEMRDLHEQAGQWVDVAQSNSQAAEWMRKGGLVTQGIYMVHQVMEGATKAFAVANGVDHDEVRRQGHQNVKLMMVTMDSVVRGSGRTDYVNHMVGGHYFKVDDYDVISHLARALEVTSDVKSSDAEKTKAADVVFESALTATPKEVERLLSLFDASHKVLRGMSGLLNHIKRREMVLELPPPRGSSNVTLTQQVVEQCRLPEREFHQTEVDIFDDLENLISDIIFHDGGGSAILNGRHLVAQFKRFMQLQTALLGTLIIGAIVWPHEAYTRYPAPPGAPRNVQAAAKRIKRRRQMGIGHYTNELGVVKHFREIVRSSALIATYLRNIQDNYYLLEGPTSERP